MLEVPQELRPEGNAALGARRELQTPALAFPVPFASRRDAMRALVKTSSFLLGAALVFLLSLDLLCTWCVLHDS